MSEAVKKRTVSRGLPDEVRTAARAALDKKATDVTVLDLRHAAAFADYFLICTGQNPRQVKAIADAIEDALRELGRRPAHVEGYERAEWILMDYFDLIVHVFSPQLRTFYALERLWGSATQIDVAEPFAAAHRTSRR